MFALNPNPTFKFDVSIPMPGGKVGKITFVFKHKGRKDLKAFFDSLSNTEKVREDHEALLDLVESWEGVDEKFSPEALEKLLDNYPGAARVIFEAYSSAIFEAREKN